MVFYVVLLGTSEKRPPATASSGVFERFRSTASASAPEAKSPSRREREEDASSPAQGPLLTDVAVEGLRLFRATGSGLGVARRGSNLVEDALPMQRTSAVLILAVPEKVRVRELCAFLGDSLSDVEALRLLRRQECSGPDRRADFYSVVALCRTQAGADGLYMANHGRLFQPTAMNAGAGASAAYGSSDGAAGPCCYMVFLESIVYETKGSVPAPLEPDVPAAAYELPACPLCLERLDVSGTGMVTHNQGWLSACIYPPASCCRACAAISLAGSCGAADTAADRYPVASQAFKAACVQCKQEENIWVCLICGHLGCGRYAAGHAKDHAFEERHKFCLDLSTGRIWDYSADVFVHRRLVQLAAASGSFELALPAPAADASSSAPAGDRPKPARGYDEDLAMELDAILASQLDYQRFLYESQLTEAVTLHKQSISNVLAEEAEAHSKRQQLENELAEAERRRKVLEKQLNSASRSATDTENQLKFVKDLNQSMLANRKEIQAQKCSGPSSGKAKEPDPGDALVNRLTKRVEELMAQISAADGAGNSDGNGGGGSGSTGGSGRKAK
eukprot:TRINITY_DN37468_c0_g1_i1.p1 TRINITY_DN37468_c0_g1~~TRINITY_DN37468_c0_g1_i1.p1  ORF type:complete len:563 (-),score=108.70 TRINITY_DN37468_c0_g1_i1:204-1892(-)